MSVFVQDSVTQNCTVLASNTQACTHTCVRAYVRMYVHTYMTVRAGSTTIYLMSVPAGALLAVLAQAPVNRLPLSTAERAGAVLDRCGRGW